MEGNGARQQDVARGRAGLHQPVGDALLQGRDHEAGSTIEDADRGPAELRVVVDRESSAVERVGAIIVGRAHGLCSGLLDADRARASGRAGLVVGAAVVILGAGDLVVEAVARNEALVLGAALEQGLPVPLGARVARDGEADEPRNGGARLDVGPLGQDVVFGCGQRGGLVDILGFRGDARGLDSQARREVGTVHDAARRPLDVAVVGRGDAIGDGDRVGRPALNRIEALVEAQVRRLLLVREGTRDRQGSSRGRGTNLGEVHAAGGRVARDVHALTHAVQAGHVRHGPHGAPLQLAGFPGGAEVAGLRGVPGQDGAGLGDDELRLTRNEGLVGRGRGAVCAVAGGGQLRVGEGASLHEAVGGHERRVRGSGHAGPAIADPRREGEGRDLPADALGVLGDRLGDAHVAFLLEVAVHAAEGGPVLLRHERRHRLHARRWLGGAVAVRVGHEAVDEEAMRDAVDHDGLLRRGLTDRQDVVGVRG